MPNIDNTEKNIRSYIQSVKNGDDEAFNKLTVLYKPLIENSVHKFSDGNISMADDIRQEALLAFYRSVREYDLEQQDISFGLWAKICITNALISGKRQKTPNITQDDTEDRESASEKYDPSKIYTDRESTLLLLKLIRSCLSGYELKVFGLYLRGFKAGEIAPMVKRTEKSVCNALTRIKIKLKGLLENDNNID